VLLQQWSEGTEDIVGIAAGGPWHDHLYGAVGVVGLGRTNPYASQNGQRDGMHELPHGTLPSWFPPDFLV
jgi:hypothetical protein